MVDNVNVAYEAQTPNGVLSGTISVSRSILEDKSIEEVASEFVRRQDKTSVSQMVANII